MKDILKLIFMFAIIVFVYIFRNNIATFISEEIIYHGSNKVISYNEYYIDNDYLYIQNIDTNKVNNYQEVLNMIYTIINSGDDSFSFFCNYDECINDVNNLINNEELISIINNFVHPYNSFYTINIDITTIGKVTVKSKKLYTDKQIVYINNYIDTFISNNINDGMTDTDKIKKFHDYIINNTAYDKDNIYDSNNAYSLITTGYSICAGYSDIMSIYLNKLNIKNYKIASQNHIWNLVYVNDKWLHIDVTWDDPVASDGNQYLIHNYFLLTTDELLKLDKVEHNFDKNIYLETN